MGVPPIDGKKPQEDPNARKGKSRSVWVDQTSSSSATNKNPSIIQPYMATHQDTKQSETVKITLQHKKSEEKLIPSKSEKKLPIKKK